MKRNTLFYKEETKSESFKPAFITVNLTHGLELNGIKNLNEFIHQLEKKLLTAKRVYFYDITGPKSLLISYLDESAINFQRLVMSNQQCLEFLEKLHKQNIISTKSYRMAKTEIEDVDSYVIIPELQ